MEHIERATFYGIYNYTIIIKILNAGFDQVDVEEDISQPMPSHENIRGAKEY